MLFYQFCVWKEMEVVFGHDWYISLATISIIVSYKLLLRICIVLYKMFYHRYDDSIGCFIIVTTSPSLAAKKTDSSIHGHLCLGHVCITSRKEAIYY